MPIRARRERIRPTTYLIFLGLFGSIIILSHLPFWNVPYFWDEAGQFVPAALDLMRSGAWVPHTALPNVHPPGVMAYLALFWKVAGFSVYSTRLAMLILASLAALAAFQLGIELCKDVSGAPAFLVVALLCLTPLFYAQALLAELDLPAMLFGSAALLFFLQNHLRRCAATCLILVLVKETGIVFPLVFLLWLGAEKRWRDALWFVAPFVAVAAWCGVLEWRTGHLFGNAEFTRYNVFYPLHPVRVIMALLRRLYFLFVADFRWIGAAALIYAWRKRRKLFVTRSWKVAGCITGANVVLFSVAGGAVLDRYLLPVLPIVYSAMAAAFFQLAKPLRLAAPAALAAGLVAGWFWNPPYPFPYDDNLAFTDFVRVHQEAADFLARYARGRRITTAWPLSIELTRPDLGYVGRKLDVRAVPDLSAARVNGLQWQDGDILVLFSRQWEPDWNLLRIPVVGWLCREYYAYQPDATAADLTMAAPHTFVGRWEQKGQWLEIYSTGKLDREEPGGWRSKSASPRGI